MSSIPQTISLTRQAIYMGSLGCVAFAGLLFITVAYIGGVRGFDTLGILFLLGAAGTQLLLIVGYLFTLNSQQ